MTNRHLWTLLIDGRRCRVRVSILLTEPASGSHEVFIDLDNGDGYRDADSLHRVLGAREGAMIPITLAGRTLVVHIEDKARHLASLMVPGL
jgi:hypothetical protein